MYRWFIIFDNHELTDKLHFELRIIDTNENMSRWKVRRINIEYFKDSPGSAIINFWKQHCLEKYNICIES